MSYFNPVRVALSWFTRDVMSSRLKRRKNGHTHAGISPKSLLRSTVAILALFASTGLTGCGLPTWHGGPNLFDNIWACPDPQGELVGKCHPDAFCFGYHATNWEPLGPECNNADYATESADPVLAKMERAESAIARSEDNVPAALFGSRSSIARSGGAEAILQDYQSVTDEDGFVFTAEGFEGHYTEESSGCSTCNGGACSIASIPPSLTDCRDKRFSFSDRPGIEDGQGLYGVEKVMGCPDCPGDFVMKCVPDSYCAGWHSTNWRVMGDECNENEGSAGAVPDDEWGVGTEPTLADEPPAPPAEIPSVPLEPSTSETGPPLEPPAGSPDLFPERPDTTPLPEEDVPDLFPQRKSPESKGKEGVVKLGQSKPAQLSPLRWQEIKFGPGLRKRNVVPASHEAPVDQETPVDQEAAATK